jgi:hypothetical protein
MSSTIMKRIKTIASRFGAGMGKKEPTTSPTLNLPDDWLEIRIPYDRQELSHAQWKAIRRLREWRPLAKRDSRKPIEESPLEEQIGRWTELGQDQETAIHISREHIPTKRTADDRRGAARNGRAVEIINEILAAFPAEQTEISRVSDFEIPIETPHADQRGLGEGENRG